MTKDIAASGAERNSRDIITAKTKLELANRIRVDIELTPSTRLVGLYIADHVNTKRGYAWCTQEQIAADLGIDERTVRRAIKDLDRYFAVNRARRAHEYRIATPDNLSAIAPDDTGHFGSDTGQKCTSIPDKNVPPSYKNLSTSSKEKDIGIRDKQGSEENRQFNAHPGSPEFEAWRTYLRDRDSPAARSLVRLLEQRRMENRPYNFDSQWPPGHKLSGAA
jgi:Helix-turn-helix domain